MERVSLTEALEYGLSMVAYFAIIGSLSVLIMFQGLSILEEQQLIGSVIFGFGLVISVSGSYGAIYKMIADGVRRGIKV
jgi:hypothetical protein